MFPINLSGRTGNASLDREFIPPELERTNNLVHILIEQLDANPNNRFSINKSTLEELAETIEINGLIEPPIVKHMPGNRFMIISGHRRVEACRLLNRDRVLCRVLTEVDDFAETMILNVPNLTYRQHIPHSEKALAYQDIAEAMRSRANYEGEDASSADILSQIASMVESSRTQIFRYLRLNHLVSELLNMVDTQRISFNAGVALSYLMVNNQNDVVTWLSNDSERTVSLEIAEKLKYASDNGKEEIGEETLALILPTSEQAVRLPEEQTSEDSVEEALPPGTKRSSKHDSAISWSRFLTSMRREGVITREQQVNLAAHISNAVREAEEAALRQWLEANDKLSQSTPLLIQRYSGTTTLTKEKSETES